jgi:hypothetical protein
VNILTLTYAAIPLLVGTLVGLFGAQLCAVPMCMRWQSAEEAALVKKAHEKKPAAKKPAKTSTKASAKKAPAKKNIKKFDPDKPKSKK